MGKFRACSDTLSLVPNKVVLLPFLPKYATQKLGAILPEQCIICAHLLSAWYGQHCDSEGGPDY